MTEQTRSERFDELCSELAARLDVAPDSERVRHIATLRLMHEVLTIKLIAGNDVDANFANAMLKVSEMLQPLLPSIEPPKLVQVEIINSNPSQPWTPAEIPLAKGGAHPASFSKPVAYDHVGDVRRMKSGETFGTPVVPPPPAPKPDYQPYTDFHATAGPIVKSGVGVGVNAYLGGFQRDASAREFSFPTDPGMKPPTAPDGGKK